MYDTEISVIAALELGVLICASRAIVSTWSGRCRLRLLPLCPPALTAPGEGLPGGLLRSSGGQCRAQKYDKPPERRHVHARYTCFKYEMPCPKVVLINLRLYKREWFVHFY